MGRKGREIVGPIVDDVIDGLKVSYCNELMAFHYYWYTSLYMQGMGSLTIAGKFKESAMEELKHAGIIAERLNQLDAMAPSSPSEWANMSILGDADPSKYTTLRSAVEKALEIEGKAIEHYNELIKKVKDADYATYDILQDILVEEVKEEQDLEDILAKLELVEEEGREIIEQF
ncbi:MAG: ferritin-like domain-containing protein [Candidatus Nitrosocaldus sp.]|nr:ferritin-like domain-containing protein [Candidatus Nitrosocaldus sp.]MDW7999975.1 ferritin-like domain-containing protein [Candidatus Nitrosocaldus sp.]